MSEHGQPAAPSGPPGDPLPGPPWRQDDFADPAGAAGARAGSGFVNLRFLGSAIGRKKRTWIIAAIIGLLLGSALFALTPPAYQSSVDILMVNNPGIDPTSAMATDALLAENPAVAAAVVRDLRLPMSATAFLRTYSAAALTTQVLRITASAPSAPAAVDSADAIAGSFLKFRTGLLRSGERADRSGYDSQIGQDHQEAQELAGQVSQVSAEPASAARDTRLSRLRLRLARARSALASIERQAGASQAQAQLVTTEMVTGSQVLDTIPATAVHSRKKSALEFVGGGLAGGFFAGVIIVVVGAVTSGKMRRRDDIAAVLGAPIGVSIPSAGIDGRAALAGAGGAGRRAAEVRRVLSYLRGLPDEDPGRPATLAIVAVDNARDVAALAGALAAALAADRKRVAVADLAGGALARVLGVAGTGTSTAEVGGAEVTVICPDPDRELAAGPLRQAAPPGGARDVIAAAFSGADVLLTVAALDPALGGDHLATWSGAAVAVVTGGVSTVAKIQSAGEMIRFAGIRLAGAVLLGADPDDDSLGIP